MLFTTFSFLLFFTAFFFLYWLALGNNLKRQNLLLLIGSYVFYAAWDYRFLALIIVNSLLNFILGQKISAAKEHNTKKILTTVGIILGLGQLFYFKYFHFFIDSFAALLHIKEPGALQTLNILLPLGISFYTFKLVGYLIDIKNKKAESVDDWVVFFSYVAFFPCIIAGPIDKGKTLIPQLKAARKFDYTEAIEALKQIAWGMYKKVIIADNLSQYCDETFANVSVYSGSTALVGVMMYVLQLYADFSGYSDIAIGISRLLGFDITRNFDYPLFAQNIAQFWRKWHMSLTQWLNEYLFTPLAIAFRDYGKFGTILAIFINFIVIGFWHGANVTYGVFGLINAIYFIPLVLLGKVNKSKKSNSDKLFASRKELINIALTFLMVAFAFIFFRANNLNSAIQIIQKIASPSLLQKPFIMTKFVIPYIVIFIAIEWLGRNESFAMAKIAYNWPIFGRRLFYYFIFFSIFFFAAVNQNFIYVQF